MRLPALKLVPLLLLFVITLAACDTEDPWAIKPPDFTSVPESYGYEDTEPLEVEEGVTAYILDEGEGDATIQPRDQIAVHITLRAMNENDEIIFSSYANDREEPISLSIREIVRQSPQRYGLNLAYTEGLKSGLLGMKEGERRTIVVAPEKGYKGVHETTHTHQYSDDTLQYDIIVYSIIY